MVLEALFELPEIRTVPVNRLVANLEAEIRQDPANVELHLNLARPAALGDADRAAALSRLNVTLRTAARANGARPI